MCGFMVFHHLPCCAWNAACFDKFSVFTDAMNFPSTEGALIVGVHDVEQVAGGDAKLTVRWLMTVCLTDPGEGGKTGRGGGGGGEDERERQRYLKISIRKEREKRMEGVAENTE